MDQRCPSGLVGYFSQDADGNGYVILVIEGAAVSRANRATVSKIWESFSDMLTEPVILGGYEILVNETG